MSIYEPYCITEEDSQVVKAIIHNVLRTRAELDQKSVSSSTLTVLSFRTCAICILLQYSFSS